MQEENWSTQEKPAEASLDWKPNGHTAPGPGIEPGLCGPQRGGSTATLPASPNKEHRYWKLVNGVNKLKQPGRVKPVEPTDSWLPLHLQQWSMPSQNVRNQEKPKSANGGIYFHYPSSWSSLEITINKLWCKELWIVQIWENIHNGRQKAWPFESNNG